MRTHSVFSTSASRRVIVKKLQIRRFVSRAQSCMTRRSITFCDASRRIQCEFSSRGFKPKLVLHNSVCFFGLNLDILECGSLQGRKILAVEDLYVMSILCSMVSILAYNGLRHAFVFFSNIVLGIIIECALI